jgi:hypothetical protein
LPKTIAARSPPLPPCARTGDGIRRYSIAPPVVPAVEHRAQTAPQVLAHRVLREGPLPCLTSTSCGTPGMTPLRQPGGRDIRDRSGRFPARRAPLDRAPLRTPPSTTPSTTTTSRTSAANGGSSRAGSAHRAPARRSRPRTMAVVQASEIEDGAIMMRRASRWWRAAPERNGDQQGVLPGRRSRARAPARRAAGCCSNSAFRPSG